MNDLGLEMIYCLFRCPRYLQWIGAYEVSHLFTTKWRKFSAVGDFVRRPLLCRQHHISVAFAVWLVADGQYNGHEATFLSWQPAGICFPPLCTGWL